MKRYLVSSGITFLTAFCIVLVAQIDTLSTTSLKDGGLLGVLFVGVRAGIKAVAELIVLTFSRK